jgi:FKBP-type peptidyl-prolyl cis-trans isomerase SlyD
VADFRSLVTGARAIQSGRQTGEPCAHNIVPGLERALEGAKTGDRRSVVLEPADAYGEHDADRLITIPVDSVPRELELRPGVQITAETSRGPVTPIVSEVKDGTVVFDANHPLAGKRLHFDVEVLDVRNATGRELRQGHPGSEESATSRC